MDIQISLICDNLVVLEVNENDHLQILTSLFLTTPLLAGRALCVRARNVFVSCVSRNRITPEASFNESPQEGALNVLWLASRSCCCALLCWAEGGKFGAKILEQKSSKVVGRTHFREKVLIYRALSSELFFFYCLRVKIQMVNGR